jgi:predicted amidohydrolase
VRIGIAQFNTCSNKSHNLAVAEGFIDKLAHDGARLVVLAEFFNFIGPEELWPANGETIDNSVTLDRLRTKAMHHKIWLHCGSIMEKSGDQLYNCSVVLNSKGERVASYRKIHLFDVQVPGGRTYLESAYISAGNELATYTIDGVTFAMATCYDLRFPEMFRALLDLGAQVLVIPAAFTMITGKDHWELLLRARAVENLCYVVAANHFGVCLPKHHSFGRSMIIDPWGLVIGQAADGETTLTADLDFARQAELRRDFPVLKHRRKDLFG